MKIFRLTMLSLAVLLFAAVIYSCSKQDQTEPAGSATEISQSKADILIENKIRAFKGKMERLRENPSYKSGETMSVDSAVWYLEAVSNYTYSQISNTYEEMIVDSFNIELPTYDSEIQMNNVITAYEELIDDLSESYHAIPEEDKYFMISDVSLKSEDAGTATIGIIACFGVDGSSATSGYFNHEWYYGLEAGDCDFNNPGTDAAEKIEDKILLLKGTPNPNIKYDEVESFVIYANMYSNTEDLTPDDNYYDYYMFRCYDDYANNWPNVHTCVSVDEMNFYYLGTNYVLNHDKPQFARPPGKTLITVDIIGDYIANDVGTEYMHYAVVQYGIPYIGMDPPDDL